MAILICKIGDCIHRSKRPSRKYMNADGSPCYGCTRPYTAVIRAFDPDGEIEAVAGKKNTAICAHYKPKPNPEQGAESDDLDEEG